MTTEEFLGLSAEKLEAMSDEEVKKVFAKYLPTTRKTITPSLMRAAKLLLNDEPKPKPKKARPKLSPNIDNMAKEMLARLRAKSAEKRIEKS